MAITHEHGDRAELAVMNDLSKRGYKILIPYGHDWRFDIVAYKDGKFLRIQVKKALVDKRRSNARFIVKAYTGVGKKIYQYTSEDIDIIAAFLEEEDDVVYIRIEDFGIHGEMSLRRDGVGVDYSSGRYPAHYVREYSEIPK